MLELPNLPKLYNINSVICFLIFFKKIGFYRFQLLHRYDVNKCERLCMGESALNLAIWQEGLVDESW